MSTQSILVIGASGRTGVELIRCAHKEFSGQVVMHAFVRDETKLSDEVRLKCASVVVGDASRSEDVRRALQQTGAGTVIISVGAGNNLGKTEIRSVTAAALVDAIGADGGVRVVALSSVGAGESKIIAGFGVGLVIRFALRHILADHNAQESKLKQALENEGEGKVGNRLLIVRATNLTDGKVVGLDGLATFGNDERAPSLEIDRADVAKWILTRVCGDETAFGGEVNLTKRK